MIIVTDLAIWFPSTIGRSWLATGSSCGGHAAASGISSLVSWRVAARCAPSQPGGVKSVVGHVIKPVKAEILTISECSW